MLWPTEASADRERAARASTKDNNVEIVFESRSDGSGDTSTSGSGDSCWSAIEYSDSLYDDRGAVYGQPPTPEHRLYLVFCDTEYVGTYWLGPSDFGQPAIQPIVDRLVRQVLIEGVRVASRPDGEGVTGIPSLFWVEGYDGAPITATEEAFGLSVTVTAQLQQVEWDFGDGTPKVRAGLGEAWPERSSVRHNYRDRTEPGRPYVVTASLVLDTSFSVNGEPATALPSITRLGQLEFEVGEIQAVRNR